MIRTTALSTIFFCFSSFLATAQNDDSAQFTKEKLGEGVNTKYLEARPLISGDGNTLYFVRRQYPDNVGGAKDFQDIYVSTYDPATNSWSSAENLGKVLNNSRSNAMASVNADGTEGVFFNTYKNVKRVPVARSRKTEKGWSTPEPVTIQNFSNVNEFADYHLSFKQNVLISAIEGDVSRGQQDLYVSMPDGFGGWKAPVNLGPVINSRESEFAPFLGSDGRSLFFASYGHDGYGGSDIFMSVRLDDTWQRWSTPVNLGPSINTTDEESFFSITDDFEYMYYTSHGARDTDRDIVRIKLPEGFNAINGPVLSQLDSVAIKNIMLSGNYSVSSSGATKNFQGVSFEGWPEEEKAVAAAATPPVTEPTATTGTTATTTDNTTSASALNAENNAAPANTPAAPAGESARYAGFQPLDQATLSTEEQELVRYLKQQLPDLQLLVRKQDGATEFKIVQNFEYDFNSVFVAPEYLPRLRRISNILKERNDLSLELIGHTDELGAGDVNDRVARQRVDNLESYFSRRGIADNRIDVVGMGNTEPLAQNDSDQNRRKNRRVETIIRLAK